MECGRAAGREWRLVESAGRECRSAANARGVGAECGCALGRVLSLHGVWEMEKVGECSWECNCVASARGSGVWELRFGYLDWFLVRFS